MSSPDRGEVWLVDLGYAAKVRPCLVISIPALNQDRALATLVPHTTSRRGSRFEVDVKVRFLKPGAFDVQNVITIPHAKLLRKLGKLSSDQLTQVEDALLFWLGFEDMSSNEGLGDAIHSTPTKIIPYCINLLQERLTFNRIAEEICTLCRRGSVIATYRPSPTAVL